MSLSSTFSQSVTFNLTHARELASRVASDLYLCAAYYKSPTASEISDYVEELALLLKEGYVKTYEFGFKKDGRRIVCWRYTVGPSGELESDRPGKVIPWADITGASYYNFMSYGNKWDLLTAEQWERFKKTLPIQRGTGSLPSDGSGYWVADKSYASGGQALARQSFVPIR